MKVDLDVKKFWEVNAQCFKPFSTDKPRVPISFWLDDHFVLEYMNLPSTIRYYNDPDYRNEINKKFNDEIEPILGKRFQSEDYNPAIQPNRFEVIMGSYWAISEGATPWLESTVESIEDVKKLIKKYETMDMRSVIYPEGWHEAKEKYEKETGKKLRLGGTGSRGPATMATSILGTVNTCMFIMDEPEIMDEFFKLLCERLIEYHHILMEDTGNEKRNRYSLTDDNCYLFSPALYERFCAPFLARLFEEFANEPGYVRHQHSDSDMGHLMEILSDLGVNEVNLGPNIHPLEIRKKMPRAVIYGQMPPFVLRNGTHEEIIEIVKRDIDCLAGDGGLVECTAGSVAGGTPLENILVYMWAVQEYGKYR